MIPLGLKETKDLDLMDPLKDFILDHYGEDSALYEKEITEFMELRQAMRTPSRSELGLELLMEYYNQLYYLEQRFFPPHRSLGVFFHWYDSLTGVPSCQRALAFEKGSVLFNMGALYTQIGARQDRQSLQGVSAAIDAFQKAAGCFNFLKENFSNAPSLDMSGASLNMLVRLMVAQVQECVYEKFVLENPQNNFITQIQMAQEAARVEDVYTLVYRTMMHPPVKDYVPFSWTTMVRVKAEHFTALSHYHAACALCDFPTSSGLELIEDEKIFLQFHVSAPEGSSILLQDPEERRKLGKAHLKRAVIGHEEAMRIHGLCKILRKMDILQEVLALTHKRSLCKYSDIDHEDDFFETGEAPDVQPKTHQKPEVTTPMFSRVKVHDIFHRLGPVSVFSAKHRWRPAQKVRLDPGDEGFGFTLRGDSPVLIAGVVPGGCAACAGVKEGSYIVSVNGEDCRWAKHSQVVQMLKETGQEGADIEVVTFHSADPQNTALDKKSSMLTSSEILKGNKENGRKTMASGKRSSALQLWNRRRNPAKRSPNIPNLSALQLPYSAVQSNESMY
ncbi:rhophilin-1 isoform X2 [Engystomops pustulosus]